MGKVINIEANTPHLSGQAVCLGCGYRCQCVSPVGAPDEMECPNCGLTKLIREGLVVLPPGEQEWTCNCGGSYFKIGRGWHGIFCVLCGTIQEF